MSDRNTDLRELQKKQFAFIKKLVPGYAKAYPAEATQVYEQLKQINLDYLNLIKNDYNVTEN